MLHWVTTSNNHCFITNFNISGFFPFNFYSYSYSSHPWQETVGIRWFKTDRNMLLLNKSTKLRFNCQMTSHFKQSYENKNIWTSQNKSPNKLIHQQVTGIKLCLKVEDVIQKTYFVWFPMCLKHYLTSRAMWC